MPGVSQSLYGLLNFPYSGCSMGSTTLVDPVSLIIHTQIRDTAGMEVLIFCGFVDMLLAVDILACLTT